MSEKSVLTKIDGRGVATLTLHRPEVHNAFDETLIAELTGEINRLIDAKDVRIIHIAASGDTFCAGGDLNWMRRMAKNTRPQNLKSAMSIATLMRSLAGSSKPTIASVQGDAFGGGVGLVACCDIAVAADHAGFRLSEVRMGLIPAVISPYLVAAIGPRAARRYTLTAERFDAFEAKRLGLVHEVVKVASLQGAVEEIASSLLKNGPDALTAAKELIHAVTWRPMDDTVVADTAKRISDRSASAEAQEGMAAFLEKRDPSWAPS